MSTSIAKIARHYQIVIPSDIRKKTNLHEGDLVSFEERGGEIIIIPVSVVKKDQAYFWTSKWQKQVKESESEIKKGKSKSFRSGAALKADIEK